ncbi:hypothetical protein EKK58_08590 [Candidatus Dependentiae bacterium]|nr:MAG: hypothetical protein EKK58_08590 [Candidatus Dependentiae bacterium]
MADVANGTSGADQKPSGSDGDLNADSSSSKDTVAYDTYRKVLAEKKKKDEELASVREELAKRNKLDKEREEAELKAKEDYKKIAELREKELNETKIKYDSLNKEIQESLKFNAFLEALPGELPRKYWGMVNTKEIVIDPSTGDPDPVSIKKVAESFQAEYGELIKNPNKAKLPGDAASGGNAVITSEVWKTMTPEEKKKNLSSYMAQKIKRG